MLADRVEVPVGLVEAVAELEGPLLRALELDHVGHGLHGLVLSLAAFNIIKPNPWRLSITQEA